MAAALVSADQLAHFRVDQVSDGLPEDALPHLVDLTRQPSLDGKGAAFDQRLERAPAEPELHREVDDRQELDHPQIPAAQPVPRLGRRGVPGDQCPVQVEERADFGARWTRVDFCRRPGEQRRRVAIG